MVVPFDSLQDADLIVDAVYEGGDSGNVSDDPLSKLLPGVGNQGGFRYAGQRGAHRFVVLYSSGEDPDWPDKLDLATARFVYYGDNKTPGRALHDTQRRGNLILKQAFSNLHSLPASRQHIPPFLIFAKSPTPRSSRSVQFKGLAAPGHPSAPSTEDLIALWKTTKGERFQNYRAIFTVLDESTISRKWIKSLAAGEAPTIGAPGVWIHWVETGEYRALTSEPTTTIRSVGEQTPQTAVQKEILKTVHGHFQNSPRLFEFFAAHLFQLSDQRVVVDDVTRSSVDGGRDAIGRYIFGLNDDPLFVDFALEAKCYQPPIDEQKPTSVGVRDVSRLISRIRHRQFGVLITTSVIGKQAYEEVREDRHPIIFISGKDIAEILIRSGYNTPELVCSMLTSHFSLEPGSYEE